MMVKILFFLQTPQGALLFSSGSRRTSIFSFRNSDFLNDKHSRRNVTYFLQEIRDFLKEIIFPRDLCVSWRKSCNVPHSYWRYTPFASFRNFAASFRRFSFFVEDFPLPSGTSLIFFRVPQERNSLQKSSEVLKEKPPLLKKGPVPSGITPVIFTRSSSLRNYSDSFRRNFRRGIDFFPSRRKLFLQKTYPSISLQEKQSSFRRTRVPSGKAPVEGLNVKGFNWKLPEEIQEMWINNL